ncbi:MAG TPA: hypothetical protein VFB79_07250 [Candidatus Angelobacter sp.]|nr:hypothetical protein [Candidatus Angelobacter sp.]
MSEQNILNPSPSSSLNPDYPIPFQDPQINARYQPKSGKVYMKKLATRGRVHSLTFSKRLSTDYQALMQWFAQYENDFFTYVDWERNRYFSGMFADQPQYSHDANNQTTVQAQFVELPGLPMFQYPSNWGVDSIFIYPKNGFGDDQPKYTGAGWSTDQVNASAKNGIYSFDATTNDIAEIIYFGYGFRYWSLKAANLGIVEISLDGTVLGTVDLYAAATAASAALFTQQNVSLGIHRVKLRCTGTKNAASSANTVVYDAIEVMR